MNYEVIITKDGSPSLRGKDNLGDGNESMHHLGGAYSETQYIYGGALRTEQNNRTLFSVLVVGLGLGYIELLAMGEYLRQNSVLPFKMYSYETDEDLKVAFIGWLSGELNSEHPLFSVYELIAQCFSKDGYPVDLIKKELLKAKSNKQWLIDGAFSLSSLPPADVNCILYDAYSGKSNPELWSEEFLTTVFTQVTAQSTSCVFATYACTGVLKRSLIASGFQFQKKPGFAGKRDCSFAIKGGSVSNS